MNASFAFEFFPSTFTVNDCVPRACPPKAPSSPIAPRPNATNPSRQKATLPRVTRTRRLLIRLPLQNPRKPCTSDTSFQDLRSCFPRGYAACVPTPIDRDEVQRLLRDEEAQLVEVLPPDEF